MKLKNSIDHFNRRKTLKSETQERWGLKKALQGVKTGFLRQEGSQTL